MRQENVESRKARALSSGSEDSDKEEKSSIVIPLRDGDSSQIFCRSTVIQEVLFQIIFAFYIELDSIANCLARLFSWTFIWSSLFLVGPELSSLSTFNFFPGQTPILILHRVHEEHAEPEQRLVGGGGGQEEHPPEKEIGAEEGGRGRESWI